MKTLNPKQEAFCNEYIIDSNGKQAAIRAGYSKKTAEVQASQLLSLLKVQDYIAKIRDKTLTKHILTATEIQEMLTSKAKEDLDANGLKALDMLNKMQGAYTEKLDITATHEVNYYAPKKDKSK